MKRQLLADSIRIDGETQSRERINQETVAEYAETMKGATATPWPPVMVYFDGTDYWMADGFHRLLAAIRADRKHISAEVKQGSRADAAWAACAANQTHGLRRTNADKRKAVEMALKLRPELSDRAIAGHCGLSDPFVGQMRRQVLTVSTSTSRTGSDGRRYPVPPPRAKAPAAQGFGPPPSPAERGPGPAEPAAGKPDYPVDDMGRRIPEPLLPLWGRRQEAQDMLTALSRIRVTLGRAQDNHDPLFSEVSYSAALAHLDQAYALVQVAKPYAVCPLCQGHGCQLCRERGLLGKFRWDTAVPREVKEAVTRLIEKEQAGGEESAA